MNVVTSPSSAPALNICNTVKLEKLITCVNALIIVCLLSEEDLEPPRPGLHQEFCVSSAGGILRSGDSWKPNACSSCVCRDGSVRCFSQQCPVADCRVPVLRKGQCCPQCMLGTCVCTDWLLQWFYWEKVEYNYYCTVSATVI